MKRALIPLFVVCSSLFAQTPVATLETFPSTTIRSNTQGYIWQGAGNQNTVCAVNTPGQLDCTVTGSPAPQGLAIWLQTLDGPTNSSYNLASSYTKYYITSGSWSPTINHLRFQYKCNVTSSALLMELGSYVRDPSDPDPVQSAQGRHYYQEASQPMFSGHWIWYDLTWSAGALSSSNQGVADPEYYTSWGNASTPPSIYPKHFYDGMTHWYFGQNATDEQSGLKPVGASCSFRDFQFYELSGYAEDWVRQLSVTYNPGDSKYYLAWSGPVAIHGGLTSEVYYATTSMHTAGLSSGTLLGTALGPDDSDSVDTSFTSGAMASAASAYFAVRPRFNVNGIVATNPAKVVLSSSAFDFEAGEQITFSGVQQTGGSSHPLNGSRTISSVTAPQFWRYATSDVTGDADNVDLTLTFASPHGLSVGQRLWFDGTDFAYLYRAFAGKEITAIPDAYHVQFPLPGYTGPLTGQWVVYTKPMLILSGVDGTAWPSVIGDTGYGVPASDTKHFAEIRIDATSGGSRTGGKITSGGSMRMK